MKRTLAALVVCFSIIYSPVAAQPFIVPAGSNDAVALSCQCYRLTSDSVNLHGAIWNQNQINLNNPFDFTFDVYLGANGVNGADGIVFVIQNQNQSNPGTIGSGMGYNGFPGKSIGVELDNFYNAPFPSDIPQNHIAIDTMGNVSDALNGPVTTLPSGANVDDGLWHTFRVVWAPGTQTMTIYFDGNLRMSYTFPWNLVTTMFGGQNMLYWGWTGSTGGNHNDQEVCVHIVSNFSAGNNFSSCGPLNVAFHDSSYSGLSNIISHLWDFGDGTNSIQTNPVHSFPGPGVYTVTLTVVDQSLCTEAQAYQFTVHDTPVITASHTNVICFGANNGTATLNVAGGTLPYNVVWNPMPPLIAPNGPTVFTGQNLGPGNYNAVVTDNNGCSTSANIAIVQPPSALVVTSSHTNVLCHGDLNGTVTINISGGVSPYTFQGNPITAGVTVFNNLSPGIFSGNVIDSFGCFIAVSQTITDPGVQSVTIVKTDIQCNGGAGGTATATFLNPTGAVTYNWSNGQTVAAITNLVAGLYSVTATDANGCTQTANVAINQPSPIVIQQAQTNINCFGNATGNITLTVSGGNPAYTYTWNPNVSNTNTAAALTAGTYNITITDLSNCTPTVSITLTQPLSALAVTSTFTNVLCHGDINGTATVNVNGGTPPYSFQGNPIAAGATVFNNLPAGIFSGNVIDSNGCILPVSDTILDPGVQSVTVVETDIACNGGSAGTATATFVNPTGSVSYNWSDGETVAAIINLPVGTYTVTATDQNSCSQTATTTISQPGSIVIQEIHTNPSCFGDITGTITLTVSGGTGPAYTYAWNPNVSATNSANTLAAGTYNITVTDQANCQATTVITLTQPTSALTAVSSHTDVLCNGANNGSVTLTIGGGTPPYTFQGNPISAGVIVFNNLAPGIFNGNVTDLNNCIIAISETITEPGPQSLTLTETDVQCAGAGGGTATANFVNATGAVTYNWSNLQTGAALSNLAAGNYSVTATDQNGCSFSGTTTVNQPGGIVTQEVHTNPNCFGDVTGSITLTVSGGTGPNYTYGWNPNVSNTNSANALAAGTYNITITDQVNCQATIAITLTQPASALTAVSSHTNVLCHSNNNGTVTLNINGGTPPYTFQGNPVSAGITILSNLSPGVFGGNVVDVNNCAVAISETITDPGVQNVTVITVDNTCNGGIAGSATATFSNPTGVVTYNWSNFQTGPTISNLSAGVFTVTVTDQNSCVQTATSTINQPAPLTMNVTVVDAACAGGNGSATANPAGGTSPYSYIWSIGAGPQTISLLQGNYTVSSTDAMSCIQTASFVINQPAPMTVQETHTDIACFGASTGGITLTVSGGVGPNYVYAWNPNVSNGNTATTLSSGTYNVTVTDQMNCATAIAVTLTQPAAALTVIMQSQNVSCFGFADGLVTLTATGGTGGYSYTWNPNVSITNTATGLSPNIYSIIVADANNCSSLTSVGITQPALPLTLTPFQTDPLCFQSTDGSVSVIASGGTSAYAYSWNPNLSTSNSINGIGAGNYVVTITDNNGCTNSNVFTLVNPPQLTTSETHIDVLCYGAATGSVNILANGGTPAYTYNWMPNVSTSNAGINIMAGNYSVTVTDANGCSALQTATVSEPSALTIGATHTDVLCFGNTNGTITVWSFGGVPFYNYTATLDGINFINSATGQFTNLPTGTYTIQATDQHNCTISTTQTISSPPAIVNVINVIPTTCYHYSDGQIAVTTSGGVPGYTYTMSGGNQLSASGILANLQAGDYVFTVTDANNCSVVDSGVVTQPDSVLIEVAPNPAEVILGHSLQLTTTTNQTSSITFDWFPKIGLDCNNCSNPLFDGNYSANYHITGITDAGCKGTYNLIVTVIPDYGLFIPNAFTPNGDGQNDFWQLFGNTPAIKQIEVMVFNRIGEKVFETSDTNFKWDGTYKGEKLPAGVYMYEAKFVWLDNHSDANYKGSITLLR